MNDNLQDTAWHCTVHVKQTTVHVPVLLELGEAAEVPSHNLYASVTSLHSVAGWVEQTNNVSSSDKIAGCRGVSQCPEHGNAMAGMELL